MNPLEPAVLLVMGLLGPGASNTLNDFMDPRYRTEPLRREELAVLLLAAEHGLSHVPPPCDPSTVPADVPPDSAFCPWIAALLEAGVVSGCGGTSYCPTAVVTREQLARWVLLTAEGPDYRPPSVLARHADVLASSPYSPWIAELSARVPGYGCGGGNYCPSAPVSRADGAGLVASILGP